MYSTSEKDWALARPMLQNTENIHRYYKVEQVKIFVYLGQHITGEGTSDSDTIRRIDIATRGIFKNDKRTDI